MGTVTLADLLARWRARDDLYDRYLTTSEIRAVHAGRMRELDDLPAMERSIAFRCLMLPKPYMRELRCLSAAMRLTQ